MIELLHKPTSDFITVKNGDTTQVIDKGLVGFNILDPLGIFRNAVSAGAAVGSQTGEKAGEAAKEAAKGVFDGIKGFGAWVVIVLALIIVVLFMTRRA